MRHIIGPIFLSKFGFRSVWLSRVVLSWLSLPNRFGKDLLDQKIIDRIDTAPGFYIEVGANDGHRLSNTLALEIYFGWRGLLIEPIASSFEQLKKNRSRRRNALVNAACVAPHRSGQQVEMIFSDLMSIALDLESDVDDEMEHALRGSKFLRQGLEIRKETVQSISMTEALEGCDAPNSIGFLSLDVEGAELEVLKGIDFSKFQISWILVESRKPKKIADFLAHHGYELADQLSSYDFLFRFVPQDLDTRRFGPRPS